MTGYFRNVMFSVYDLDFDEEYGINVSVISPEAQDIEGHFQTALKQAAAMQNTISDVDTQYSATITIRTTPMNDAYINEGDEIKVLYVKDPETRVWIALEQPEHYTIKEITVVHPAQREKVLFLLAKGVNA